MRDDLNTLNGMPILRREGDRQFLTEHGVECEVSEGKVAVLTVDSIATEMDEEWFESFLPSTLELSDHLNPDPKTDEVEEVMDALARFFRDEEALRHSYNEARGTVSVRVELHMTYMQVLRDALLMTYGLSTIVEVVDDEQHLVFPVS
jgi:hypothetical protein